MLEGAPIWDYGFVGFRLGDYLPVGPEERLMFLHPYRPGRIPLVLVHGTSRGRRRRARGERQRPRECGRTRSGCSSTPRQPDRLLGRHPDQSLRETAPSRQGEIGAPDGRGGHSQGGLVTRSPTAAIVSGNVSDAPRGARSREHALLRRSLFFRAALRQRLSSCRRPHGLPVELQCRAGCRGW
jgi:hypothetical protein